MKWRATGAVAGSKYLGEVEAATEEEAREKAWGLDSAGVSLCHQCSSECEDPEVQDIYVDPVEES